MLGVLREWRIKIFLPCCSVKRYRCIIETIMNILASVLFVTGICLILKSFLDIIPTIKKWREDKKKQ